MASRRSKTRALTVASMTLPRTPESNGAAADAAAGGALDGGVGVGVGVVVVGGDGDGDGWALMVTAGLLAAASWLGWPPPPGSAASTSFATPGSDVFGRRAQQEALRAIDGSQSLEAAAHVREHPLARRLISTRRPHKRPADARRSIDEMTSLPTSTSSAAHRRPRQKPRTMPLDTSLKLTVPSTKPRAGIVLERVASSATPAAPPPAEPMRVRKAAPCTAASGDGSLR